MPSIAALETVSDCCTFEPPESEIFLEQRDGRILVGEAREVVNLLVPDASFSKKSGVPGCWTWSKDHAVQFLDVNRELNRTPL